jgi:hypothetical protein
VFKIRRFEGRIRVSKHVGPHNSTRVELLNHQTSKNSVMSFWMKISLWLFKIRGFEGGIGIPKRGGPLNSTGAGLLNHQTSKNSPISFWTKNSFLVYELREFEGGIGVSKCRGPLNSTEQQGCHKGQFWKKITVRTSFSSERPPASAITPQMRFYLRTGFYRPPTW